MRKLIYAFVFGLSLISLSCNQSEDVFEEMSQDLEQPAPDGSGDEETEKPTGN